MVQIVTQDPVPSLIIQYLLHRFHSGHDSILSVIALRTSGCRATCIAFHRDSPGTPSEHRLRADDLDELPAQMTLKCGYHIFAVRIRKISGYVNRVKCRMVTANIEVIQRILTPDNLYKYPASRTAEFRHGHKMQIQFLQKT
jgi:hypothetical protein